VDAVAGHTETLAVFRMGKSRHDLERGHVSLQIFDARCGPALRAP
jgi:hypothetical protein